MALSVGDRTVRPLTADEVLQMVDAGIVGEDEPVELLHGVLTAVSPQGERHALLVQRLTRWLAASVAAGHVDLRVRLPLRVPDPTSLPEPDLAVVDRTEHARHPTTALLVIEIAVTSQATDTRVKPALYAAAGVPEYWVVDVSGRRLLRSEEPAVGGYRRRHVAGPGGVATPSFDVAPLALAELFAGL